jgi:4-amino-4-deoxy-L-arabinose transferase-like glycosyltransferase
MMKSETMNVEIEKSKERGKFNAAVWFWSVAGFFVVVWALFSILFNTGYKGDAMEMQLIAKEWVLSTRKLPCLPSWILEFLNILTHRSFAVPFIASALCALLALWSVWKLGRTVLDERLALIGTFAMLPYCFLACKPLKLNHNVGLFPLWALSIYLVFQAFQTNQKRYWISAGIALGLAFHAKLAAILLAISILIYMLIHKNARGYFRTPGPYITMSIAFLVFLPQVIWVFYHDFATIQYATDRSPMAWWLAPLSFITGQVLYWVLSLIILTPVIGFVWQWKLQRHKPGRARDCEKFLFCCAVIPIAFFALYGGIKGQVVLLKYGSPIWIFGGLWLLLRFQTKEAVQSFRQVVILTITTILLIAAGFTVISYTGKLRAEFYLPARELAAECDRIWYKHYSDSPPYMAGDLMLSSHAAHFMLVRPSVIMPQGTWADDNDLNQKGGMIVWERIDETKDMPEHIRQRFPNAWVLPEILELPYKTRANIPPLKIGVAIVPPPGDVH